MGKLSELVKREYDEETEIIRDTGNLWSVVIGLALVLAVSCGIDYLRGKPWDSRDLTSALVVIIAIPFIDRAWERHKVAAKIRHEREIRIELKLDGLLGLVNIDDG